MELKVLVVDDSSITRRAQARMLGMTPFSVVRLDYAGDGQAAIDLLQEAVYDLILCDLHMPGLGGVSVLSATRAGRCLGQPRFVFVTSDHNEQRRERLLRAGADAYLLKPLSPEGLTDCLNGLFGEEVAA